MPFLQKPATSPADVQPYDATSTEEDGFEVIHGRGQTHEPKHVQLHGFEVFAGLANEGDLDGCQLEFVDRILERAEVTKTAFFAQFSPLRLTERHLASKDPAFLAMCSRGIELLSVDRRLDDGSIALAARRTVDAAEAFLNTPAARDPQLRKFGLDVRLRARETMQERIERTPKHLDQTTSITERSDEFVLLMRERARLMAEFLGVHRAPELPGIDFILDAHGKVAFAFKPMTASAPPAVCLSRLIRAQALAMREPTDAAPVSTAMIVSIPGRAAHGTDEADEAEETFGVLMIPPSGFDLCLAPPGAGEEVGRRRLADALARPLDHASFDQLALAALCAGEHRVDLDGVLVDEGGRAWVVDHGHLLAGRPADIDAPATGSTQGRTRSTTTRVPTDMPMRPDRLHALAELDVPEMTRYIETRWKSTPRERQLLAEALGKTSKPDIDALDQRLWPTEKDLDCLTLRLEAVRDWAGHCMRKSDQLLEVENPLEVEDLIEAVSKESSIRWFLSTFGPTVGGERAET